MVAIESLKSNFSEDTDHTTNSGVGVACPVDMESTPQRLNNIQNCLITKFHIKMEKFGNRLLLVDDLD